jgi:hypothetical protein
MSVPFNNFLTGGFTDTDAALAALADEVFYKDGRVAMTSTFNAGSNSLFAVGDAEFQYSLQVVPPAGALSLYAKADDQLYISDSKGNESHLSSGGDVDGPVSAVDSNLCSFDGITGKLIKDSGIDQADITIGAASSVADNVVSFQDGTGKALKDSGVASADLVTSSNNTVDSAIVITDTIGTNGIKEVSVLTCDANGDFSKGGILYFHNIGTFNIGVGIDALRANTGSSCTGVGYQALEFNTGGNFNSAFGSSALSDTLLTGEQNSAFGASALVNLTTGVENVAMGYESGKSLTTGLSNTFIGANSGEFITTGNRNIALGRIAGDNLTLADSDNIDIGNQGTIGDNGVIRLGNSVDHVSCFIAGINGVTPGGATETVIIDANGEMGSTSTISGDVVGPGGGPGTDNSITRFDSNTGKLIQTSGLEITDSADITKSGFTLLVSSNGSIGLGIDVMSGLPASIGNAALGDAALENLVGPNGDNVAVGRGALNDLTNAPSNVACGAFAGSQLTTGSENICVGRDALLACLTGDKNICVGHEAGQLLLLSNNICIGNDGTATDSAVIRLGSAIHTTCFVEGISGATIPAGQKTTVVINSSNQLVADVNHLPIGYVHGMKLEYSSATTVNVLAGDVRDEDNEANIHLTGTTSVVITTVGAGGLMTGQSEAADTTYEVHAMHDDTGVNADNAFLVPQGVTPAETGYSHFRYLGWVHNDASSNFINFYMGGKGASCQYWYYTDFIDMRVLNNGSATTWTTMVGTTDSVADFCGQGSTSVILNVAFENDVVQDGYVGFRPNGDTGDHDDCYRVQIGEDEDLGSDSYQQLQVPIQEDDRDVQYQVNNAGLDIDVAVVGVSFSR